MKAFAHILSQRPPLVSNLSLLDEGVALARTVSRRPSTLLRPARPAASRACRRTPCPLLGFAPVGPIAPPPELDDCRMTNPDAHALGHYLRLGERAVVPLLTCPLPLADVLERTSVLGVVRAMLLEIDPDAGTVVRDAGGAPVLVEAQATDWSRRIARNSMYTIHPEEVAPTTSSSSSAAASAPRPHPPIPPFSPRSNRRSPTRRDGSRRGATSSRPSSANGNDDRHAAIRRPRGHD